VSPAFKFSFAAAALAGTLASAWPASVGHATVATAKKKTAAELREPMIRQMIVKLRNPKAVELTHPLGAERVAALSASAGVRMSAFRPMSGNASVLRLERALTLSEAKAVAARLANDPNVEYADPDLPVRAYQTVPPDVGYTNRLWHYYPPTRTLTANGKTVPATGGANLEGAWSVTRGASTVVVAVIDTGVVSTHPELAGKLLQGYDFVSSDVGATAQQPLPANFVANDNNGRDADPEDPGDWISTTDTQNYPDFCGTDASDSSWHGTHMAGTIAGVWGNGVGNPPPPGTSTAGIAPDVRILPLRALGKCGGSASDVIDAMRFAVGIPVPGAGGGLVANGTPAHVVNLSLGGQGGACSAAYQQAVDDVINAGALVVAAAGNDGVTSISQPANCVGVLGVVAHTIDGDSADYSNAGPQAGISAPGGGAPTQITSPIVSGDIGYYTWSPVLFGPTTQQSSDRQGRTGPAVGGFTGTSSATAHVSAVAALLKSAVPSATPAQLRQWIVASARPHPGGTFCATGQPGAGLCGAGLLDASAAMNLAVAPPPGGGSGGGGTLPLWQLLLLAAFGLAARIRSRD
jgi:serine protease